MRRRHAIRDSWPLLVWIAICAVTAYAYMHGIQFKRMNGRVFTYEQNVAALNTALITRILVKPGEIVTAGQPVVHLEDAQLDLEIAAEREGLLAEQLEHERRIFFQISGMRTDLAEMEQDKESEEAELVERKRERTILDNMRKSGGTTEDVVAAKDSEIAALQARIDAYPNRIKQLNELIRDAEKLQRDLNEAIKNLQAAALKPLELEKAGMVLTSHKDGMVAVIHYQEGETVEPGISIMEIVSNDHDVVLGFIPAENIGDLEVSQSLHVSPMSDRNKVYRAEIISIAPKVSGVPDRASPLPDRIIRGRKIYLKILDEDNTLLPGEQVVIHLQRPKQIPFLRWWK